MSNLRQSELRFIGQLVEWKGAGYVLDFSNRTFDEFFREEIGINIYDDAFADIGTSKGKRLRSFLQSGQPKAVARALSALWEYRQSLLEARQETDDVSNSRARLSAIIERLGGDPLASSGKSESEASDPDTTVDPAIYDRLLNHFDQIHNLQPQSRGYAFEKFLSELFNAFGMSARNAFRLTGEQIDGSFQLDGETYLLEAKWHNTPTGAGDLHSFQDKLQDRLQWARGLFVSYTGFTKDALSVFQPRRVVLVDGLDIHEAIHQKCRFDRIIAEKSRRTVETKRPLVRVRDII